MAGSEAADVPMADPAVEAKEDDGKEKAADETPAAPAEEEGPSAEERVTTAEVSKEAGNALLKGGDFAGSVEKYEEGIGLVKSLLEKTDIEEELQQRRTTVYVSLCLNAAQACIKQSKWTDAAEHADNVLAVDKENAKALFRRGVASMEIGTESRLEQAQTDITRFVKLEPSNREARERLATVKERVKEARQREKARYAQAMTGALYQDNHKKHDRQKLEYEEEVKRRAEAEEDEITWEDWQKKLKEKAEADQKKQKEAQEARATELREAEEQRLMTEENERREKQGLEPLSIEEWRTAQKNIRGKEEVVNSSELELDEEERKMLEEQKAKGYYHGRLGTVLSDAAPKPQQMREASPDVTSPDDKKTGSEWNQAGTWEERDTTAWVKERLSAWLGGSFASGRSATSLSGEEVELSAVVTKVKSISGDAQIVNIRKQKRCGYNFEAELSFRIKVKKAGADEEMPPADADSPSKDKGERYDGTLGIPELCDTIKPQELRFEASWKGKSPPEHLKATALEVLQDLKSNVREQVQGFLRQYDAH